MSQSAAAPPVPGPSQRPRGRRADYRWFDAISTRWLDNDQYGHVNNAVYYLWLDAAVNRWLIEQGALEIDGHGAIGFVVESGCRYHAPVAFPQRISAGVRTAHVGTSSIRYEVGFFADDDDLAAAEAFFVHVYVDRDSRRPQPLSPLLRDLAEGLRA